MKTQFKVGSRVVRKDSPEVEGTIISLHGRQVRVYWSQHFSQLVDLAKLTLAVQIHEPQTERTKHDDRYRL
jgi:hypothetical protein